MQARFSEWVYHATIGQLNVGEDTTARKPFNSTIMNFSCSYAKRKECEHVCFSRAGGRERRGLPGVY
jgi:hypothetical protein